MSKDKKTVKETAKQQHKDIKKIGTIPSGYTEGDVLFMEDNKIFIAKK